jgi:hypothetical protein
MPLSRKTIFIYFYCFSNGALGLILIFCIHQFNGSYGLISKRLKFKEITSIIIGKMEISKMKNKCAENSTPDFGGETAQADVDTWKMGDSDATCIESKVGMTIAVEIQGPDEHFTILDLKMYHQECEGGFIEIHKKDGYHFRCKRCDVSRDIAGSDADKEGMVNAALEGKKYKTLSTNLDVVVFMSKTD